jgi:hypothetical protein
MERLIYSVIFCICTQCHTIVPWLVSLYFHTCSATTIIIFVVLLFYICIERHVDSAMVLDI